MKIRPATREDKDDVLEIAKHIWDGHDYLPHVFEEWLSDPNSHTAALEIEGRVVALNNLRIIENGTTGWLEGLRVHPDFRRKGLAHLMTDYVVETANRLGVKRLRYTTDTANVASLKLAERAGLRPLLEMGVAWSLMEGFKDWDAETSGVNEVVADEVHSLLQKTPSLLPHDVIIYDWKALDVTREALKEIASSSRFWVSTEAARLRALSIGTGRMEGEQGRLWLTTVYTSSKDSFLCHLLEHIRISRDASFQSIMFTYPVQFESLMALPPLSITKDEILRLTLLEKKL
ncbi:MAG: GNAT family N-acetyltransferase [Candidatus Thorarchaeota archaeon]